MFTLNTLGREVVIIIFSFDLYKLSSEIRKERTPSRTELWPWEERLEHQDVGSSYFYL